MSTPQNRLGVREGRGRTLRGTYDPKTTTRARKRWDNVTSFMVKKDNSSWLVTCLTCMISQIQQLLSPYWYLSLAWTDSVEISRLIYKLISQRLKWPSKAIIDNLSTFISDINKHDKFDPIFTKMTQCVIVHIWSGALEWWLSFCPSPSLLSISQCPQLYEP